MNSRAGLGMSVIAVLGSGLIGLALAGCEKDKSVAPAKVTPAKASQAAAAQPAAQVAEQTNCPVMGGAIDKNIFVEYKGKKVYFCCKGCVAEFQKEPEKYVSKLPQFAQSSRDESGRQGEDLLSRRSMRAGP